MLDFILGTFLIFLAFVLSTWLFAINRKLLWLANPKPYKNRWHHGMVLDEESGLAKAQQRPIYEGDR